jgi:hypothetical protein
MLKAFFCFFACSMLYCRLTAVFGKMAVDGIPVHALGFVTYPIEFSCLKRQATPTTWGFKAHDIFHLHPC